MPSQAEPRGGVMHSGVRDTLTTSLACARCLDPIGAAARQGRLLDLTFHEVCAVLPQLRRAAA